MGGRTTHFSLLRNEVSNKNSFYGEMKNDKLWQMETMNCVRNLLCHMCCAMHESWWREVKSSRWGRMKWLYGSICNAIKWTLNMHNNPLLSLSLHLPVVSLPLVTTHTRNVMNSCKTIISLLLRNKFLFFCSLALFHFWANLKPCKKVYFIIHFHSNSNHNVCFIYVKAYSSLYSSTASCRWRIFTGKHLTSLSCLFFASHTFALEITSL